MKRKNPKMEELDYNLHANLMYKYEITHNIK